jgi:hypothetical protein
MLELSLKSDLGVLATLTQLEVFGCDFVNQRIGVEERELMDSHWPRLRGTKVILQDENEEEEEYDEAMMDEEQKKK